MRARLAASENLKSEYLDQIQRLRAALTRIDNESNCDVAAKIAQEALNTHEAMTTRHDLEPTLEKYAPDGYDLASDDMTIPFAIELAAKDAEIADHKSANTLLHGLVTNRDETIEQLRAALKPFAYLAGKLDGAPNLIGLLTEADFKRAAEAFGDEQKADGTE